ncbi:MAG: hypothetical protein AAB425_11080 [Bdellovibrionota bacterium]
MIALQATYSPKSSCFGCGPTNSKELRIRSQADPTQPEAPCTAIRQSDRATVEAELTAKGKVTASCTGTFVAVKEGHPAFHRW